MKTNASSSLEEKTREDLIKEIQRLQNELQTQDDTADMSGNGKFDEDELIALGSTGAGEEMYIATDTGKILFANDRFADELGFTPEELVKQKVPDIDQSHSRAQWLHFVSTLKKSEEEIAFETTYNINGGGTIDMAMIASYINYHGKNYILCQSKAIGEARMENASNGNGQESEHPGLLPVVMATVSEGVIIVDTKGTITGQNATASRMLGTPQNEITGKSYVDPRWRMTDSQGNPVKISDHPASVALVTEMPVQNKRMAIMQPDGALKYLFVNAAPLFEADGSMSGAVFTMRYQGGIGEVHFEAAPAIQTEAPPERENGLGELAQRFSTATSVFELERAVCDMLIKNQDYGVVWIGTRQTEESRVEPSYSTGPAADYLLKIKERADNSEVGKGPTGTAIKTKQPSVFNDISTDPAFSPWRRQALRSNLQAFASFPIVVHGKVYGVLNLAAKEKGYFDPKERLYLENIAQFLSFGVQAIRDREMNAELEEHNVLNNLLVDTYMQNTDAAVAVFDAKAPFMCLSANEGFLAMLDEPFRSAGVKDATLTDFTSSLIHKNLFDAMVRTLDDMEPQTEEGAEFQTMEGDVQRWNWIVFPIIQGDAIRSLLYFAVRITSGENSEEAHILDNLGAPVYSVSYEKREVLYANSAAGTAFGLKMGMPANQAVPYLRDIAATSQKKITASLEKLAKGDNESVILEYSLKPLGEKKSVKYRHVVSGIFTEAGILRGVQCIVMPLS